MSTGTDPAPTTSDNASDRLPPTGSGAPPGSVAPPPGRTPQSVRGPGPVRTVTAAGWAILAICLLHTLAFSVHPYWADWLAGPLREGAVSSGEAVQFWGLPGGFVVPGAILGHLVIRLGRGGRRPPRSVGWVLALWAAGCLWMIGPSGFLFVLVPAGLLIIAGLRTPRGGATADGSG